MGQKPPETSAERYRRRAEELRQLAQAAQNPETRQEMMLIARQYDQLAEDVDRGQKYR